MGEGPKDLRDDAGRFDAPRQRRHGGSRGSGPRRPGHHRRGTADADHGRVPVWVGPGRQDRSDTALTSTTREANASSDSTETAAETAEIRAEIEQKRADISETIDEITQRLSPGNLVSQATDSVKETARDTMHRVSGTATRHGAAGRRDGERDREPGGRLVPAGRTHGGIPGARAPLVGRSAARRSGRGGVVDDEPPFERRGGMGRGRLHRREPLLRRRRSVHD